MSLHTEVKLVLNAREYTALHTAADGRGKKAQVEKELLRKLLVDHSRALSALQDLGYDVNFNAEEN